MRLDDQADSPGDAAGEQSKDEPLDFEAALAELEALVGQLEGGTLSLEDSLAAFERGVKLTRTCQSALRSAELRIKALTQDGDEVDLSQSGDVTNAGGATGAT